MTEIETILDVLHGHLDTVGRLLPMAPAIAAAAGAMATALEAGGRVYWVGNGGSAADSQHLASELVGRFERERRGLASVALTTDTSVLTSIGNDYGFEQVYARQVQALCSPGDVLVALSTSGTSPNILRALDVAGAIGCVRIGLSGRDGGGFLRRTEHCLLVPSENTARIQEAHLLIGHILCRLLDAPHE